MIGVKSVRAVLQRCVISMSRDLEDISKSAADRTYLNPRWQDNEDHEIGWLAQITQWRRVQRAEREGPEGEENKKWGPVHEMRRNWLQLVATGTGNRGCRSLIGLGPVAPKKGKKTSPVAKMENSQETSDRTIS
jgi:hypothetical protein